MFLRVLLSSPRFPGCWFLVAAFFAASWLNHRFYPLPYCAVISNGSRSRPCLSSPPGSGHYMHLNHLAGLLPFFEPSIEWEDSMPSSHFRLDRPTSRGLHTFVPLPPSSLPPTMVSHGGIPSHMVVNPEPNLRPTTTHPPSYMDGDHTSTTPVEGRNPALLNC